MAVIQLVTYLVIFRCPVNGAQIDLRIGDEVIGSVVTAGPLPLTNSAVGGANFWANWQLSSDQSVVAVSRLRWLQLAEFNVNVPGFPSRPFIDPRQSQLIGNTLADARPWYDISGSSKTGLEIDGGGDDPWMGDGAVSPWVYSATFIAQTFVVEVIDVELMTARVLGGVEWGYRLTNDAAPSVDILSPIGLSDSPSVRAKLNGALSLDFGGWSIVPAVGRLAGDYNHDGTVDAADYVVWRDRLGSGTSLPNDDTPGVGPDDYTRWRTHFGQTAGSGSGAITNAAVPEPATLAMLLVGMLAMCPRRRVIFP